MNLDEALAWIGDLPLWVACIVLFAGAFVEYVFPPAPGDMIVLGGAALVGAFAWPLWPIFAAVTAGALAGTLLDYELGTYLVRAGKLDRLGPRGRAATDALVARFRRHGAVYLAVNRFLPGIRAYFFVAAGLAGLRRREVLAWSALSALAWNGLLVGAGFLVGQHVERLETWLLRYSVVAWLVVSGIIALAIWRVWAAWRGAGGPPTGTGTGTGTGAAS